MTFKVLSGNEASKIRDEMQRSLNKSKQELDNSGAKTYEGVIWKDGLPHSIDIENGD